MKTLPPCDHDECPPTRCTRTTRDEVVGPHVEWEIVLSGGHSDIFVIVSAPENATDAELQSLAETEALAKTYIWSKKRVRPNRLHERPGATTQKDTHAK